MLKPLHVPSNSAPEWAILGERVRCLIPGEKTGGAFALFQVSSPAGLGPPLHVHTREDEVFHILEGEYEFTIEGKAVAARPGDTLFAPRNQPHTYRCIREGKMLVQAAPSGFEHFFAAVADRIGTHLPPDMAVLGGLFEKAGLRLA